jgi:hypothetical protein
MLAGVPACGAAWPTTVSVSVPVAGKFTNTLFQTVGLYVKKVS